MKNVVGFENKKYGLLGEHLPHSFSPLIHSYFAHYPYELYEVQRDKLEKWVKNNDLAGYNVTIPYKAEIMKYCDELSDTAKKIGAVNTVLKRADGTLFGDNTDYFGFSCMIAKLGIDLRGKKAVVLGSGGASKTVQTVLSEQGAKVVVISRQGDDNYDNIQKHKDAVLIVNATPVGMYPDCPKSPVDLKVFESLQAVCDLIYNPAKTALLMQAESMGIKTSNGLLMLVAQAKRAVEIFRSVEINDGLIDNFTAKIADRVLNIVLIGMPGCGKSTVGKILSEITGRAFADSDEEIYKKTGKTPAQIIENFGVEEFRSIETEVLKELSKESGRILATGGGAVTVSENYPLLVQNSKIVFIERDLSLLATEGRPLSQNLSKLYEERLPLYKAFADVVVDGNRDARAVAEDIIEVF
ncbi:MAG: shikimate kinase [Ruminococcus sp.]|nr:shikimate kinase [Ruminococcus sp.]